MQIDRRRYICVIFMLFLLAVAIVAVQAQDGFAIDWYTVDGGGGTSSGGDFALTVTIGQVDVGEVASGGVYGLRSGFLTVSQAIPTAVELVEMAESAEIIPRLLTLIAILLTTTSLYLFWRTKEFTRADAHQRRHENDRKTLLLSYFILHTSYLFSEETTR